MKLGGISGWSHRGGIRRERDGGRLVQTLYSYVKPSVSRGSIEHLLSEL